VTDLPRSTPAEQGVDAAGIEAFVSALAPLPDVELHSLMVLRHGHVVDERWWHPYAAATPHLLYSLSKSFTATALGLAVGEGTVDLDATVLSYFPELDAEVTDARSRSMLVRHAASMASGHEEETFERARKAGDGDLLRGLLLTPPEHDPGTIFAYNQPCTHALSAIVQRVSGVPLTGYLRPRLFAPLGITGYGWLRNAQGRDLGYSGLYAPTEAIAKLGQLHLDDGVWAGERLLPAGWVAEATRSHVQPHLPGPDWAQGYGFQFWRSRHGYRGDGAYGQLMVVLPEADAVVAVTSQSPGMQAMLDALWEHLLPALTAGASSPPPAAAASAAAALSLPGPPGGGPAGEPAAATYLPAPANEVTTLRTVRLDGGELTLTDTVREVTAALGAPGAWTTTGPLVTAHAWDGGRLRIDVIFVETPHRLRLILDPATGRFEAAWQTVPLGDPPLAKLRTP
jgi:CubicO group peptidase (beta-lactamase class C family)